MKSATKSAPSPVKAADDVDAFMAALKHPLKTEIEAVRRIILGASPKIGEAIKWNAPSFRTTEFFATMNLRATDRVQLIFHLGAKVRPDLKTLEVADPAGLVKWLAKDRCMVTIGDVAADQVALADLVRQWIGFV